MNATATVGPITVTEKPGGRIDAACVCGMGMDVPPTFGGIPQQVLLSEWAKQHAGHKPNV